ncbi:MAG: alkaline phosphatase family protein [Chthoniobacteraceae bacterium]
MNAPLISKVIGFASLPCFFFAPTPSAEAAIQYVIAMSVDGCRGDFLQTFIETTPANFPNFVRLRNASAYTYNARPDFALTITIPDHLCMLTGRPVDTQGGVPLSATHGVTSDAPGVTSTIHVYPATDGVNSGPYKTSIFDMVHDRGLSTALYLGKDRLAIATRSWNATNGAADFTGVNNGKNKVDFFQQVEASGNAAATPGMLTNFVTSIQNTTLRNFTFFHFADTDYAGHSSGWTTTVGGGYRNGMLTMDGWLGQILDAIQNNAALMGKVAILLTADHGGGTPSNHHNVVPLNVTNYTIPFFLSAPGVPANSNIYSFLANRVNPGSANINYTAAAQPMRNGDIANLAATLLGVPFVTGSTMMPEFVKPTTVASPATGSITVTWPIYLTNYALEYKDDLNAATWTTETAGIAEVGANFVHTVPGTAPGARFFRLRRP